MLTFMPSRGFDFHLSCGSFSYANKDQIPASTEAQGCDERRFVATETTETY